MTHIFASSRTCFIISSGEQRSNSPVELYCSVLLQNITSETQKIVRPSFNCIGKVTYMEGTC